METATVTTINYQNPKSLLKNNQVTVQYFYAKDLRKFSWF